MKILAATPQPYSRTIYIVQLTANELQALTTFHLHSKFPVTTAGGAVIEREQDKCEAGDEIDPEIAKKTLEDIREVLDTREELHKVFGSVRAAMTRLQTKMPLTK